ncbi:hypothetical protein B0H19DRAFT_1366727 [Mycena capillaripes]|nr:hypothetical protein B0H19DRAFT_1366727 [Mycena capillaripes]
MQPAAAFALVPPLLSCPPHDANPRCWFRYCPLVCARPHAMQTPARSGPRHANALVRSAPECAIRRCLCPPTRAAFAPIPAAGSARARAAADVTAQMRWETPRAAPRAMPHSTAPAVAFAPAPTAAFVPQPLRDADAPRPPLLSHSTAPAAAFVPASPASAFAFNRPRRRFRARPRRRFRAAAPARCGCASPASAFAPAPVTTPARCECALPRRDANTSSPAVDPAAAFALAPAAGFASLLHLCIYPENTDPPPLAPLEEALAASSMGGRSLTNPPQTPGLPQTPYL